ncbi:hypothetical protein ACIPSA_26655 [Streptomyces sp. NPDC086549]|uniref:hypothetical protein n=1 Tax=Streptomyces sp. NPDC086549 TaxID=3365752 RepID=UPI0037F18CC8
MNIYRRFMLAAAGVAMGAGLLAIAPAQPEHRSVSAFVTTHRPGVDAVQSHQSDKADRSAMDTRCC